VKTRARPRELPGGGWIHVDIRRRSPAGYCTDHTSAPHLSAAQSEACWRSYLLNETLRLNVARAESGPCKACGKPTNLTVVINGYPRDHWCKKHQTSKAVAEWWNAATAAILLRAEQA
jgi:hypothetical protein